jgi:D-arabinose 1-dehydrogenase-like Zn-dependent alcohol dehydrogenase
MHVAEKSVSTFQALKEKIESKTARVGIVGLGYVGLPLAVEFAKAGFHVTGIPLSASSTPSTSASPRRCARPRILT